MPSADAGGILLRPGKSSRLNLPRRERRGKESINSLMMISNVFMMVTRSMASGKRILEVLDEEIEIQDESRESLTVEEGGIDPGIFHLIPPGSERCKHLFLK